MEKQTTIITCLLFFSIIGCKTPQASLDEEALLNLAPRITLEEPDINSFLVEGVMNFEEAGLRFVAAGMAPDHISIRIFDIQDETPLMMGADNAAMIYDPLTPKVLTGALVPQFYISLKKSEEEDLDEEKNQAFTVGFAVKDRKAVVEENRKLRRQSILIDIASILAGVDSSFSVVSEDKDELVYEATSERGNKLVVFVTPDRKEGAYTRVELYLKETKHPFFTLNRIVLNQPVPEEYFTFPTEALWNSGLPVTNCPSICKNNEERMSREVLSGVMARIAMNPNGNPQMRENAEGMLQQKIDWESLREKDQVNSAILRAVFKSTIDSTR